MHIKRHQQCTYTDITTHTDNIIMCDLPAAVILSSFSPETLEVASRLSRATSTGLLKRRLLVPARGLAPALYV